MSACSNQAILAKAFRGELVPQDPSGEPASVLLERIRAERANSRRRKGGAAERRRNRVELRWRYETGGLH